MNPTDRHRDNLAENLARVQRHLQHAVSEPLSFADVEEDTAIKMLDVATERLVAEGWKPAEIGRRARDSAAQIVAMKDPRMSLDLTEFG